MLMKHKVRITVFGLAVAAGWTGIVQAQVETFDLSGLNIQFIEGTDPAPAVPAGADAVIFNCIADQGATITNTSDTQDDPSAVLTANDLVVITDDVGSGDVSSDYLVDPDDAGPIAIKPIIQWEPALIDAFQVMNPDDNSSDSLGPCIEIIDVSHPITAGLPGPGKYQVYTEFVSSGMNSYSDDPANLASGALVLALASDGRPSFIVAGPGIGDGIANDGVAFEARQVHLFINTPAANFLTDFGKTLVNRSIAWSLGMTLPPIANPPDVGAGCGLDLPPLDLPALDVAAYVEEIADHTDGESNDPTSNAGPRNQGAMVVRRAVNGTIVFERIERFNFDDPPRGESAILASGGGQPRTENEVVGHFGTRTSKAFDSRSEWTHIIDMDGDLSNGKQVPENITEFTIVALGEDMEPEMTANDDFRYNVTFDDTFEVGPDPLSPGGLWDTRPSGNGFFEVFFGQTFTLAEHPEAIALLADGVLKVTFTYAGSGASTDTMFASTLIIGTLPTAAGSVEVVPASGTLSIGDTLQLEAQLRNVSQTSIGPRETVVDLTSLATFSLVDDTGAATVSDTGLVTAVDTGLATIEVTIAELPGSGDPFTTQVSILVGQFIDLGDIVSAGNGKGSKLPVAAEFGPFVGLDQDFGIFQSATLEDIAPPSPLEIGDENNLNPTAMDGTNGTDDSPFIDVVFTLDSDTQTISTAGASFTFRAGDSNPEGGFEFILDSLEPVGPALFEAGPAKSANGIGIHAAAGLTFDLNAIRTEHGLEGQALFFSTVAGEGSALSGGSATNYIILSEGATVLSSRVTGPHNDSGEFIEIEIPPNATHLTLATGDGGDGIDRDHGVFLDAFITGHSVAALPVVHRIDVVPSSLLAGGTAEATLLAHPASRPRLDTPAAADAFTSSSPSVATVDASGTITTLAPGTATISAMVGGQVVATATVEVLAFTIVDQVTLDFDTTGPTSVGELPDWFDYIASVGPIPPNWGIDPNDVNSANPSNALHLTNGNTGETDRFSDLALLQAGRFEASDVEVSADLTFAAGDHAGIYVRFVDPNNFYYFYFDFEPHDQDATGRLRILAWRMKDGIETRIIGVVAAIRIPVSVNLSDTARVTVRAVGNQLSVLVNGLPVDKITDFPDVDPVLAAGRVGFGHNGSPLFVDNIVVSSLEAADVVLPVLPFVEGFETDGEAADPQRYTTDGRGHDGPGTAFWEHASEVPGDNLSTIPGAPEGSDFWASSDLNETFGNHTGSASDPRLLELAPIDLSGFVNVTMTVALANSDPIDQWETSDFLRILLDKDNDGTFETTLADFNGGGDPLDTLVDSLGAGTIPINEWVDFTFSIPDDATNAVIRFESLSSAPEEVLGIDNIRIREEEPAGPELVQVMGGLGSAPDTFTSPLGEDVPFTTVYLELSAEATLVAGAGMTLTSVAGGEHMLTLDTPVPVGGCVTLTFDVADAATGAVSTITITVCHLPLDVNQDGVVNIADITAWANEFNGDRRAALVDTNGDGAANVGDATQVGNMWFGRPPATKAWNGESLP